MVTAQAAACSAPRTYEVRKLQRAHRLIGAQLHALVNVLCCAHALHSQPSVKTGLPNSSNNQTADLKSPAQRGVSSAACLHERVEGFIDHWPECATDSQGALRPALQCTPHSGRVACTWAHMRMRFTMNPGRSRDRHTVFPRCSDRLLAVSNTCKGARRRIKNNFCPAPQPATRMHPARRQQSGGRTGDSPRQWWQCL